VRVRYTQNASAELNRIVEYIARDNPSAASAVVLRIEQVAARLALFPGIGHSCNVSGVLVAPLVRFPYSIYYTIDDGDLVILHVHHGARRPPGFHEADAPFFR
jgi:plasmid stabilization system protein ParE